MQASDAVHLRVDNLNVVRHVGRLMDGVRAPCPLELEDDGDLIGLIWKTLYARREGTACISEVKGHADEEQVRRGQVWELDRDGSNRADEAADFGTRGVWPDVIDAGRNLSGNVFSLLAAAGDSVKKGSYHTAWSVLPLSSCSCSCLTGRAQLSGHKLGSGAGHCSLDCGGLSRL